MDMKGAVCHVCAMLSAHLTHDMGNFGVVNGAMSHQAVDHPGIAICHESPVNRQISIVGASNREGKMGTRMISTHSNQN